MPWWPRPDVKLFNILVHMLTETSRHAGHADIPREQIDGSTGTTAQYTPLPDVRPMSQNVEPRASFPRIGSEFGLRRTLLDRLTR
ncbi:DUF664 domain-containing protein [Nocardia sp. NPDC051052]|uniref:mycothiol transferase n=1 Tax=Nocardia sp. NPDC051052 TaxID=3364322 RepID=UPI0037A5C6EB